MPSQIVFVADSTYFDFQATLDGTTYTHRCRWNVRLGAWFMDVLNDAGDTVLLAGLRLVASWPLAVYQVGRQPGGVYACIDTSGANLDPQIDDFGTRVELWYWTQAESWLAAGIT